MAFFKKWLSSFAKPKEVAEETIQEEVSVVSPVLASFANLSISVERAVVKSVGI